MGDATVAEAVGEESENCRGVEDEDDTDMGSTGAQGLDASLLGGQAADGAQDQPIGQSNEETIKDANKGGHCQAVCLGDGCIRTGQFDHCHELTVAVGNDPGLAEGELPHQKWVWGKEHHTSCKHCTTDCGNAGPSENCGVSQRVADGHITVVRHGQEEARLHGCERVDEEHLGQAGTKADVPGTEPEDGQHLGQGGGRQHQVSEGQHAKEEVHGLVETRVCLDEQKDGAVPQDSDQVHGAEGNSQPEVQRFQARNAQEEESSRPERGEIGGRGLHGEPGEGLFP